MFTYVPSIMSNQVFLYPLPGINEKDGKDENLQKDAQSWTLIVEDIRDGLPKQETSIPRKDTPKTYF